MVADMSKKAKKNQVWGGRLEGNPDEANLRFCAGRDVTSLPMADKELLGWDVWTNLAHTKMLCECGVLSKDEYRQIYEAFEKLDLDSFDLDPAKEDVHINLEHYLVHTCGIEAGKKIHSGRSRNDQVATDMRLYLRWEILYLSASVINLALSILERAQDLTEAVMPGFTHYQPAMPTSAAHWLTAWSQGLLRDLQAMNKDYELINRSPLGSAAGFGTSWPINRERTAELLGFDQVEENTLDAISSRGEAETRIAGSIGVLMNRLSQISQDLILWSHPFYGIAKISDQFVTGSSIMPQKRNPDFAELIRAKAAQASGTLVALMGIQKGAMSGYNRDSQQSKYLIMDLFREVKDAPVVLTGVIETLTLNQGRMEELAKKDFLNAADWADWLAQEFKLSFRDCYEILSLAVKYSAQTGDVMSLKGLEQAIQESGFEGRIQLDQKQVDRLNNPKELLKTKTHSGAPSPDSVQKMIKHQRAKLAELDANWTQLTHQFDARMAFALEALKPD